MSHKTSRWASQELATWRALMDTTTDLRRVLGAQLAQECDLSPADHQVLLALSEADDHQLRPALYVGSPETVARKIATTLRLLDANRFDLKYAMGGLSHDKLMTNIELYGTQVVPLVREELAG
jgi:alkanesulfonate monooxygenase SsuD/methylene tetrahydromethanopterin reductase-like flavin-dependent oxidoreductase (luciferase family)